MMRFHEMQDNFYGTQRSWLLIGLRWFPAHGFWQPPTWLHGKVCSPKMSSTKRDFDVSSTAKGGFRKLKLALSHDFSLDFDQQKPWLQTGKCCDVGMSPKVIRPVDPWFAYRSVSVHVWIFGAGVCYLDSYGDVHKCGHPKMDGLYWKILLK